MLGALVLSQATLDPIIIEMGSKYGIEPELLKGIIKTESNWDVNASRFEAHKGDASWGLMQLMLATARAVLNQGDLTTTQLINPKVNIEAGAKLMAENVRRYKGVITDAIAAYNAGSARFSKVAGKEHEYVNQPYVDKVWKNYRIYKTVGTGIIGQTASSVSETLTDVEEALGGSMTPVYIFGGVVAAVILYAASKKGEA